MLTAADFSGICSPLSRNRHARGIWNVVAPERRKSLTQCLHRIRRRTLAWRVTGPFPYEIRKCFFLAFAGTKGLPLF